MKDCHNNLLLNKYVDLFFSKNKISKSQQLQKYFKKEWFIYNLKNDVSTFVEPKNWEDPFEDFISKLENNNSMIQSLNITVGTYAQSWISKKTECDGMWRNFSSLTDGVLIHTTAEDLIRSLFKYLIEFPLLATNINDIEPLLLGAIHIKKITYETNQYIADLFKQKTENLLDNYTEVGLRLLSVKRKEFEYENEYRIFIEQPVLKLPQVQYLEVGYFKNLINSIIVAPQMSQADFDEFKKILVEEYGLLPANISKSKLYDIEHFKHEFNL